MKKADILNAAIAACPGFCGVATVINGVVHTAVRQPNGWKIHTNGIALEETVNFYKIQLPVTGKAHMLGGTVILQFQKVNPATFEKIISGTTVPKSIVNFEDLPAVEYVLFIFAFLCYLFGSFSNGVLRRASFVESAGKLLLNISLGESIITIVSCNYDATTGTVTDVKWNTLWEKFWKTGDENCLWEKLLSHPYVRVTDIPKLLTEKAAEKLKAKTTTVFTAPTLVFEDFDMDVPAATEPPKLPRK